MNLKARKVGEIIYLTDNDNGKYAGSVGGAGATPPGSPMSAPAGLDIPGSGGIPGGLSSSQLAYIRFQATRQP